MNRMPDHVHDHGHGHGGCGHGAAGKAGEEMGLAYSLYQVYIMIFSLHSVLVRNSIG
mgnify:FL=1